MRFPISPHYPYVRHSTTGFLVVVRGNGPQKSTYCLLMQTNAYEIKEKLLRALDKDYNVVDMAAVFEVLTHLEKASITRETLEKTRIGRYINALRKRTDNEQLARRAKELVKSWRKLLPQSSNVVNGERVIGPPTGPGPGISPILGNKLPKPTTVPGSPQCKTTSPSIICERSASPYCCSSASSSPQSVVKFQGSNRPLTPSKSNQIMLQSDKVCLQNKAFNSPSNKNDLSSQIFKPVSPALQTTPNSNSSIGSISCSAETLPQLKVRSPCTSPAQMNNARSFCLTNTSAMYSPSDSSAEQQKFKNINYGSHSISSSGVHSSLKIAKTNAANKRLRKSPKKGVSAKRKKTVNDSSSIDCHLHNGTDSISGLSDILQHSPSSSFKSFKSELELEQKKSTETNVCHDVLKDKLSSMTVGTKLSKVKTTQQLIEELQAKKDALYLSLPKIRNNQPVPDPNVLIWRKGFSTSELQRSKSELMKKFLLSSPESPSVNSGHESPVTDRVSSPLSDNVPSKSSVITSDKDFSVNYTDPVDAEIDQIMSQLPPIDPEKINFDEDPVPEKPSLSPNTAVEKYLTEHWEHVNGDTDMHGIWHPWNECVDKEIEPGEVLRILPYVNID